MTATELAGWVPAIIIPAATFIQLAAIIKLRSAKGVSALTWILFGIANICLYIYTEKYTDIQTILGMLGAALLDFIIASLALMKYGNRAHASTNNNSA